MFNKMTLIGNVGSDPEMRYTPNGNPVTSFSVATNRRYTTSEGEQREETEWFRVSAWNRLSETCNQYVVKGMRVYVEGSFSSREWTDQEGQTRTSLEINCNEIRFLSRNNTDQAMQNQNETGTSAPDNGGSVEDLPW